MRQKFKLNYRQLGKTMAIYTVIVAVGAATIYFGGLEYMKSRLSTANQKITDEISIKDDVWDISKYTADPEIPGPFRMYVFTSEGFVVDRWRPIAGFFNISGHEYLSRFTVPQTVDTITGQRWRVYSVPVKDKNNDTAGVIAVASFDPRGKLDDIDTTLKQAAEQLAAGVSVQDGEVVAGAINPADIAPGVSFQVVNRYNRIVTKSNNTNIMDNLPDTIDPTYVVRAIQTPISTQVADTATGEQFLVSSLALKDEQGAEKGLVVTGIPITFIHYIMTVYAVVAGVIAVPLLWVAILRARKNHRAATPVSVKRTAGEISEIKFLKKESVLMVGAHKIPLTYATNQYYICAALFSARKKQWETGELLEKFGEHPTQNSWRIVYDAATAVNRKTSKIIDQKLIINNNGTYQLNPQLLDKIV